MGYSYGRNAAGREVLACDGCGKVGGVRKRTCPYTVLDDNARSRDRHTLPWCQPPAYCPNCWTARKGTAHASCKDNAARAQAEADATQARLDAGELIVISAKGDWADDVPAGMVRVTFGGAGGKDGPAGWVDYLMPADDYGNGGWLADYPNAVPVDQAHTYVEQPDDKYAHLAWGSCSCGGWRSVGAAHPAVVRRWWEEHAGAPAPNAPQPPAPNRVPGQWAALINA